MRPRTPTTTPTASGDAAKHGDVLVYHPGECPAWKAGGEIGRQQGPAAPATQTAAAVYTPLVSLLHATPPDTLSEARRRVALLDRAELIRRYVAAYADGKRLVAYVMASELIERRIPPSCWREAPVADDPTLTQRADLVLADLTWLRRWHPEHASAVRYQRGKALLTGSESVFFREAEFAFYQGKRPAWKVVGSMSMTERQQWEAAYLRSTPIKRAAEATSALRPRVQQALHDDLRTVRRTTAYGEVEAAATLVRRIALWDCSRIVKDGSPTEIAARYQQMTGIQITRQAVAKQLDKLRAVLCAKGDDFSS